MLVEEKTSGELRARKLLDERARLEESIQEMRLQGKGSNFMGAGVSKISRFLERILMEHIDMNNSLDSKLQTYPMCSIRTRSRK